MTRSLISIAEVEIIAPFGGRIFFLIVFRFRVLLNSFLTLLGVTRFMIIFVLCGGPIGPSDGFSTDRTDRVGPAIGSP